MCCSDHFYTDLLHVAIRFLALVCDKRRAQRWQRWVAELAAGAAQLAGGVAGVAGAGAVGVAGAVAVGVAELNMAVGKLRDAEQSLHRRR